MKVLTFNDNKLIDEIFANGAEIKFERTGSCRYQLLIEDQADKGNFSLWTTKKGQIQYSIWNS